MGFTYQSCFRHAWYSTSWVSQSCIRHNGSMIFSITTTVSCLLSWVSWRNSYYYYYTISKKWTNNQEPGYQDTRILCIDVSIVGQMNGCTVMTGSTMLYRWERWILCAVVVSVNDVDMSTCRQGLRNKDNWDVHCSLRSYLYLYDGLKNSAFVYV